MRVNKSLLLVFIIILLTITVSSQISQTSISLQENKECITTYYNATEKVYDYVTKTRDSYGTCYNSANSSYYTCLNGTEQYQVYQVIGTQTLLKNKTQCTPRSYEITLTKGSIKEKKKIDFSNWGVCINSTENDCIAITCGSQHGGSAVNGIFNGCDGGKSCQKFLFCPDGIKALQKAARGEFVGHDPTFHLPQLAYQEVGE